jgi:hypothetical protein
MASPETPEAIDKAILRCLLDRNFDLWAVAALERKIGDRAAVAASLARLRREGLIYEGVYGFVTATKAARLRSRRRRRVTSGLKGEVGRTG